MRDGGGCFKRERKRSFPSSLPSVRFTLAVNIAHDMEDEEGKKAEKREKEEETASRWRHMCF